LEGQKFAGVVVDEIKNLRRSEIASAGQLNIEADVHKGNLTSGEF
jgi:hypothetical protein